MADTLLSPNMSLPVPVVGVDPGPDFATNINTCLSLLDSHNHAPGSGIQIDPTGININADLQMNSNNLIGARTARFTSQSTVLSLPADLSCLYAVLGDLYFNDGLGNQIRLTQSGSIVGTAGSITGLASPASASYVAANSTFVWQSGTNIPANLDAGSVILRKVSVNSPGITLSVPSAISTDYNVILPPLPAADSFMCIDQSGNITAPYLKAAGIPLAALVAAVQASLNPAGAVLAYAGASAPTGYLICDGSAVSRTTYAALFAVIGITAGQGNGTTTFNVPDYRGRFLRGVTGASANDPDASSRTAMNTGGNAGNNVSSVQGYNIQNHAHTLPFLGNLGVGAANAPNFDGSGSTKTTSAVGGNETRPINAYVNFIIKT